MYLIGYDIYAGQKKLKALKNLSKQDELDWMKNKNGKSQSSIISITIYIVKK